MNGLSSAIRFSIPLLQVVKINGKIKENFHKYEQEVCHGFSETAFIRAAGNKVLL